VDPVDAGPLTPEATEAAAAVERVRTAIDDVLDAYEHAAAIVPTNVATTAQHIDALRALMGAVTVRFAPPTRRGACLLGLRDLRGLSTEHLLVGGLTEAAFPGPTEPAPLLSEADAALAGARTSTARRREADYLVAHVLASARRSLVVSWPSQQDGADALPALALETSGLLMASPARADEALFHDRVVGRGANARQLARSAAIGGAGAAQAAAGLAAAGADLLLAAHKVDVEHERTFGTTVSRCDGMIEPAGLHLLLPETRDIVMSASRFEDYVKCPLYFFFRRVLDIEVPDAVDRELSPMETGSLIHEILYRFHDEVPARTPEAETLDALERITDEGLLRRHLEGLFAEVHRDSLLAELRAPVPTSRQGALRAYLDYEKSRKSGFRPALVEARFGEAHNALQSRNVLSEAAVRLFSVESGGRLYDVHIRGSIDRVDVLKDGDITLALVLDYKSGSAKLNDKKNETLAGRLFQIPLYSHVLPLIAPEHLRGLEVIGGAFYGVGGEKTEIAGIIVEKTTLKRRILECKAKKGIPDETLRPVIAASVARAKDVVQCWLAGRFHPTADDGDYAHCRMCDFRSACRGAYEGPRVAALDDPRKFPQSAALLPGSAEEES